MNHLNDTRIRPATQKQFDFIKRLLAERVLDDEHTAWVEGARQEAMAGRLASQSASSLIDSLLTLPKRTTHSPLSCEHPDGEPCNPTEPEAGIYVIHGDHYVRVYHGQQSGRMLAKRISWEQDGDETFVSYEYLGLASKVLVPAATPERLPLEEVGSLGIATNHCLICGRRLDDPESVDRGIGPVCAANY